MSLKFTPEALAGILSRQGRESGTIQAIAGANASVKLPAEDIVVVHRLRWQRH